jgi:hypothetical protein
VAGPARVWSHGTVRIRVGGTQSGPSRTPRDYGRERKRTAWNFAVRVEMRPSSGEKGYRSCYPPAGRSRSSGDKISELKRDRCFLTRGT